MSLDKKSYVFRKGVTPNTRYLISSKNRIFAWSAGDPSQMTQIGAISSFDISEARTAEPVRGIGFGDQISELVPGVTDPISISCVRTALYLSNVMQAFGYKAGIDGFTRSLKHHRWPFDIRQEIVFSSIASEEAGRSEMVGKGIARPTTSDTGENQAENSLLALITYYEGCWMVDYTVTYAADTAIVTETVTINATDVLAGPGFHPYSSSVNLRESMSEDTYSSLAGKSARFTEY